MRLKARINDQEHDVILKQNDSTVTVEIDGRAYSVEAHESEDGHYLLFNQTEVFDCRVEATPRSREVFNVRLRGKSQAVTIVNPKRLRSDQNSDHHHQATAEIVAPMPGKVVRVLVATGAPVEKGAAIVVVEAMKMQNEMKSPRTGEVVSIRVQPGDTVNAGDVMAVVE